MSPFLVEKLQKDLQRLTARVMALEAKVAKLEGKAPHMARVENR